MSAESRDPHPAVALTATETARPACSPSLGAPISEDVARVFVGCDPNNCDFEQMMVLEYSLRRHASIPVEIHWMQLSRDPASPWYSQPEQDRGWRTDLWVTPFSGFRWAIPALCGYQGRAIYMDADMVVLRDIADLWRTPFTYGQILAATKRKKKSWRYCVMVWDCAAAKDHLPPLDALRSTPEAHANLIHFFNDHPEFTYRLHPDENNVDGENRPLSDIRILHYSDIGTQFTHKYAFPRLAAEGSKHWFDGEVLPHPRADLQALFDQYHADALAAGYTLDQYRNAQPFGAIVKASQVNYTGNRRTRRMSLWSRIKWRLRGGRANAVAGTMAARQETVK
ncbi:glycosyltransferase [Robbsia andropogonis]|uniref:glycosyltransferase n=1 Tax=Robbsia andropogonis TaxID=28092 RepID=UPI003D238F9A